MHTNLHEGCEVFTMDGDKIGEVKEVRGDYFKVDAKMQPDYWLACGLITAETASSVTLSFNKDQLGDYKSDIGAMETETGYTAPISGSEPGYTPARGATTHEPGATNVPPR